MPLLSEFANYVDRETDARRWARMLYCRPISMEEDYFINYLKGIGTSVLDKNAGGFLKHKLEAKAEESEKGILKGGNCDPVSYE